MVENVCAADLDDLMRHVPLDDSARADVLARMGGRERRYHNTHHIALLWQRHRQFGTPAYLDRSQTDMLIASAIAYHDCIYDSTRGDNEEMSARHWLASSEKSQVPEAARRWVADTIRATSDHLAFFAEVSDRTETEEVQLRRARQWVLDLDLTPLGERPDEFDRNAALLREEFAHLDDSTWDRMRLRTLHRFKDASPLYGSPALAAAFEAPARHNLQRQFTAAPSTPPA